MSARITVLPDEVANHIAAGEVIERPASVVKELVENALDAEASHLNIEIGGGGKTYIRVADDGYGMSREDAERAFERHATSKIGSTADLSTISTLGFRGEALPSIASVAKVKLVTCVADALVGTRIEIHGGEVLHVSDSGAAPGTFIEVRDLFYKTPARLKFLKSAATEVSYINAVIIEEALAHPTVGFSVKHNARDQLHVPTDSELLPRIAGLFGRDLARDLVEVQERAGSLELRGLIGLPSCHRANRNYQKVFVNQRPVKDKVISHAIQQAYDTIIPKRRHAVVFLFLTLPAQLVDVNVHPTKSEIRFVHSQAIHHLVSNGLRTTLSSALNRKAFPGFAAPVSGEDADTPSAPAHETFEDSTSPESALGSHSCPSKHEQETPPATLFPAPDEVAPTPSDNRTAPQPVANPATVPAVTSHDLPTQPLQGRRPGMFGRLKPIGQFRETYLLVQGGDELFIIDQHAAHERIYYEQLKTQFQDQQLDIQRLLFPVSVELSHREQAVLEDHLDMLRQYGLELEHFGATTYLLKAVPALLARADYKKLLYDVIDQLAEAGETVTLEQQFNEVLILMACHAAIRAHQPLQPSQIRALLQQMDEAAMPYTCPHGRPTIIKIHVHDLEKKFSR
jgi:DNA mismatch repair protein MutL